jgi:hypothetical protein
MRRSTFSRKTSQARLVEKDFYLDRAISAARFIADSLVEGDGFEL